MPGGRCPEADEHGDECDRPEPPPGDLTARKGNGAIKGRKGEGQPAEFEDQEVGR